MCTVFVCRDREKRGLPSVLSGGSRPIAPGVYPTIMTRRRPLSGIHHSRIHSFLGGEVLFVFVEVESCDVGGRFTGVAVFFTRLDSLSATRTSRQQGGFRLIVLVYLARLNSQLL